MEKPEERRRFSRFNLLVDVLVSKRPASEKERLLITKNISQGGACIVAYDVLKESDILDLKIFLPGDDEAVKVTSRVAWVKEIAIGGEGGRAKRYDVGVEFVGVDNETMSKLNKHLVNRS